MDFSLDELKKLKVRAPEKELLTIYHIPGIKYGCTNNIKRRSRENRDKYGKDIVIEVVKQELMTLTEAADIERELNKQAGYKPWSRYDAVGGSWPAPKTIECPHCGTSGGEYVMQRWHFDKCEVVTGVKRTAPKKSDECRANMRAGQIRRAAREKALGISRRRTDKLKVERDPAKPKVERKIKYPKIQEAQLKRRERERNECEAIRSID